MAQYFVGILGAYLTLPVAVCCGPFYWLSQLYLEEAQSIGRL